MGAGGGSEPSREMMGEFMRSQMKLTLLLSFRFWIVILALIFF